MTQPFQLTVEPKNFDKALVAMKAFALPPKLRRRYLARIGRMVIAQTKRNQRDQKTVSGPRMTPRRKGSPWSATRKGKMFKKMVRSSHLRVKLLGPEGARVDFGRAGPVAAKHHHGFRWKFARINYPEYFDPDKVPNRLNRELVSGGCTANLAATLIRCDHVPPHAYPLPAGTAAKLRRIMQTVTRKQALFLISRAKSRLSKRPDFTDVDARPILGATDAQIDLWSTELFNDLEGRFRAKDFSDTLT